MNVSEVWALSRGNENALGIWERRILRKIFGPVRANSVWKIRTSQGLRYLYGKKKTLSRKFEKENSLLGHVKRRQEERTVGGKKSLKIYQKEKGPLESQETDG
jgi:hypothetical protein